MQDFKEDENVVKVIRSRKSRGILLKCGLYCPLVSWLAVMILGSLSGQPIMKSLSSGSGFLSTFNLCMLSRDDSKKKTVKVLEKLSKEISKYTEDSRWSIRRLDDIIIIPKNIKVDEDLESLNIVPIFKKGKFIIMKGTYSLEILAQYEEDGKTIVKMLDKDEVAEAYNEFDEKIKRKIQKNYSYSSDTASRWG